MATSERALIPKDVSARLPGGLPESRSPGEIRFQGGQITVKNGLAVDPSLIHRVLSPIPRLPFRVAILLSSGYPPYVLEGLNPGSGMLPRRCLVLQKDPAWLTSRLPGPWDAAINIAPRTCTLAREFPVYFALTVLQELAHARIAHRDLALHMVQCMLFELMWDDAVALRRPRLEYDLPGEKQCIRAALRQARKIFGSRVVDRELARMSPGAGSFLASPREVRVFADWILRVDPEGRDINLYEETRILAGPFAPRLLSEWRTRGKGLQRVLRLRDLKRIVGA